MHDCWHGPRPPRVLAIAGTDPSGGAGTAADTKSITAAGGYAMTAVTALVAQSTRGVRAIHTPPVEFLREQLAAVVEDVEVDAVKTGMLGNAEIVGVAEEVLADLRPAVVVVDPVMVATSGDRLLEPEAHTALRRLCASADVVTPNIPELAILAGADPADDEAAAVEQARRIAGETGARIVVKTGHLSGGEVANVLVGPEGVLARACSPRVETRATHGTGCSLSSALATRLTIDGKAGPALAWVTAWLHEAVAHGAALNVGRGRGPVDHSHRARRLETAALALGAPEWEDRP